MPAIFRIAQSMTWSSCAKIRNLMSVLFNHAWWRELLIGIPSSSFARAPRDRPLPMSSPRLKSSSSWIILTFENEHRIHERESHRDQESGEQKGECQNP
jgi:hypothetical protein